jgi:hypothetical protein
MAYATHDRHMNDELFQTFQEMKRRAATPRAQMHPRADEWGEDAPTVLGSPMRRSGVSSLNRAPVPEARSDRQVASSAHWEGPAVDIASIAQTMVPASELAGPSLADLPDHILEPSVVKPKSTSLLSQAAHVVISILAFVGLI